MNFIIEVRNWLSGVLGSRRRLLYALAILPVSLALLLSLSRGALVIGIPAALVAMGFLAGGRWRRLTVVVLVLGALAFIPLMRTPRFAGLLDWRHGTTSFRLALWHSAWAMFQDHPFLGVGPDNFLYAYRSRYVLPTAWEEFNLSHPHNVVMDFATRLGVVGLAVFVWMQALFWRRALPLRHRGRIVNPVSNDRSILTPTSAALALGIMGSMVDFLAHGLVDASYFVIDLAFVYFLSFAVVVWISESSV
jgi:O-antigen ligase